MSDTITIGSTEYRRILHRCNELKITRATLGFLSPWMAKELADYERVLETAELAHEAHSETVIGSLRLFADPADYDLMMSAGDLGGADVGAWEYGL